MRAPSRQPEPIHQRLAAMVPGANGDAAAIEQRPDVVRMDAVEDERHNAGLLAWRPNQAEAGNLRERTRRVLEQRVLVQRRTVKPDAFEIREGGSQPHRTSDMGRTRPRIGTAESL